MKKILLLCIILTFLCLSGCQDKYEYDDTKLWDSVNSLTQRVGALEKVQEAYKNNVLIESVETTDEGYIITFSDGTKAVIVNDKPIDLPEDKDTCYIDHIDIGEDSVHFYLTDGSDFIIKMAYAISIEFEDPSPVTIMQGQSRTLNFHIESDIKEVELEVLSSGDLKAKILDYNQETGDGSILLSVANEVDDFSKVVLIANNGRRISMRRMEFSNEGIGIFDNSEKPSTSDGGLMELEFVADTPAEAVIPENAQSWIRVVPQSRSLSYNCISIEILPNEGNAREADIIIRSLDGTKWIIFHIRQERNVNAVDMSEEQALRTIMSHVYEGTDFEYMLSQPISTWSGVELEDGHVVGLQFFRDLKGELPKEIGALVYLKRFIADGGLFQLATLPEEFSLLQQLEELEFTSPYGTGKYLAGPLPDCIYELQNLKRIEIQNLDLSSIDSRIKNLSKLEYLDLTLNKITSFPFEVLPELKSLKHFSCYGNYQLTGKIPTNIGNLENLEYFNTGYCNLSGDVPSSFWKLAKLKEFALAGNNFNSIRLPESIAAMKSLEGIALSGLTLTGSLPQDIGELKNLRNITLEICKLKGSIPTSIENCTNLESITLFMNELGGEIPKGLGNLPHLTSLNLSHNNLRGSIPEGLGKLESLWLFDNRLTGKIPDDIINSGKLWRNYWGYVIYENELDFTFEYGQTPGPVDLGIYHDTAVRYQYDIEAEYSKHDYTIIFGFYRNCAYVEDAVKLLKDVYNLYDRDKLEVIGWTYPEEPDNKEYFQMPWPVYFGQQINYPCYVAPTITVIDRNGYVVFSDLVSDRFTLPEWLKSHIG